jgi:16S rRNA processing protein RimM
MNSAGGGGDTGRGTAAGKLVVLGRISGVYGVRGWVRVFSHTDPRENILSYRPWFLRRDGSWESLEVAEGRRHGKGVVARLEGIDDREAARALLGLEIAVDRDRLGMAGPGEYFWTDLEGLEVVTTEGRTLGVVDHLFETGANDVMVVKGDRERLVPFSEPEPVREVDLEDRRILVDWDPDY